PPGAVTDSESVTGSDTATESRHRHGNRPSTNALLQAVPARARAIDPTQKTPTRTQSPTRDPNRDPSPPRDRSRTQDPSPERDRSRTRNPSRDPPPTPTRHRPKDELSRVPSTRCPRIY